MINEDTPQKPEQAPIDEHAEVKETLAKVREYLLPLLIGAGIAIVLFIGYNSYVSHQRSEVEQASLLLATADTPEKLHQVINQYPESPSAPIALLTIANNQYHEGQYESALNAYSSFIRDYPGHLMLAAAELGRAVCYEAQGQFEEGLQMYDRIIETRSESYLVPEAVFGKARCMNFLGKPDEARAVYEDFIAENPDSTWLPHAELALRYLDQDIRARE